MNKTQKEALRKKLNVMKKSQLIDLIISHRETNESLNMKNSDLYSNNLVSAEINQELRDLCQITESASRNFKVVLKSLYQVLSKSMLTVHSFEENIDIYNENYGKNNERDRMINELKQRMEESGLNPEEFGVE